MKILILALTILCFAINAYAVDFSTINTDSIKAFLEIFPQYKDLAMKYGEETTEANSIPVYRPTTIMITTS